MFFLVSRFDEVVDGQQVKRVRHELFEDEFDMAGFQVVEVPDNVPIDRTNTSVSGVPAFTYQDLLEEKYTSILDINESLYDYVEYFDLLSGRIDLTASGTRGAAGSFGTFLPKRDSNDGDGRLQTEVVDVSGDAPGSFNNFSVYWSVYIATEGEDGNDIRKEYNRVDPDDIQAFISNDGGSSFQSVNFLENTSLTNAGNQIVVRFENPSDTTRYYLGDFGFLY